MTTIALPPTVSMRKKEGERMIGPTLSTSDLFHAGNFPVVSSAFRSWARSFLLFGTNERTTRVDPTETRHTPALLWVRTIKRKRMNHGCALLQRLFFEDCAPAAFSLALCSQYTRLWSMRIGLQAPKMVSDLVGEFLRRGFVLRGFVLRGFVRQCSPRLRWLPSLDLGLGFVAKIPCFSTGGLLLFPSGDGALFPCS